LQVSEHLRVAKFLSPTSRCHTFSSAADGYVRSEGGVCFLVARDDGVSPCHGLLLGSAINQNSRRKPITSVDPAAQSTLITDACKDAGVSPNELAAVEMHGTGTRLGDPVEVTDKRPPLFSIRCVFTLYDMLLLLKDSAIHMSSNLFSPD
jgi:acyl transferase domain-containing protein